MAVKPTIIVTIVHIEGPLKGEIQEFSDDEIRIGRNLGYQVQFPRDVLIVSRDHARIIRDGNRFKLVNHSENMTYLNGKPVGPDEEAFLKSGDWLMFAQGGPKVSFLTKIDESRPAAAPVRPVENERPAPVTDDAPTPRMRMEPPQVPAPEKMPPPAQPSQAPLVIRYGPMLKRFNSLPVTIGNADACDFRIQHAGISDEHIQIYFSQGQYCVKDLTGRQTVRVNDRPVAGEEVLNPDDRMELSSQGPVFRFLAGGRLDEIN